MKTTKTTFIISNLLLAAVLAWTAGCASTGSERSGEITAANIQAAANEIGALPNQIDKTLASLSDLVNKPQADLRPQFNQFVSDLDKLEASARDVEAARQSMARKSRAFMAKWDEQLAQIRNEDIAARSQDRRREVSQQLNQLKSFYSTAADQFKPFLADLRDVQKFLGTDLTTGGLASIRNTVAKANESAGPLNTAIARVADNFKALGLALSSVTPQPEPAK
jgi:chromosome segregation ATPase